MIRYLFRKIIALTSVGIVVIAPLHAARKPAKTVHWNWNLPDKRMLHFPPNFLWGSATSSLQVEGNCSTTDWNEWEQGYDRFGKPRVESMVGQATDHWNRYEEDIRIMAELGLNCYRFSIDWAKIQPTEDTFDDTVLDHYKEVCQTLMRYHIKPIITLHHFTCPNWFMDKGGFEKSENISYFVKFSQTVFETLHSYVHLWLTFNSPTSYAIKGYWKGTFPPGVKNIKRAAQVLAHIFEAHVQVYQAIQTMPGGKASQVGILHNIFQIEPWHGTHPFKRALEKKAIRYYNKLASDPFYEFFLTGTFKAFGVKHVNKMAPLSLDFIGLNYYSRGFMKEDWFSFEVNKHPHEMETDHDKYTIYPEGFYAAIREISQKLAKPLNLPIYITENGIATSNETARRIFFERYLYALSRAIEDGHDVRGYITWSFIDNYSWGTYRKKYGLIGMDPVTGNRTALKPGAKHFIYVANKFGSNPTLAAKYNLAWLNSSTPAHFYSWVTAS